MLLYLFLLLSHILGLTAGDTISPDQDQLTGTEGKSVTMKCNYQTADSYPRLYWYKHDSDLQAPQFILWKGAKSYSKYEHIPDKRYGSRTIDTSTELIITELTLADTALYYCAAVGAGGILLIPRWFGNPIKLTVIPEGKPQLFAISPLDPPISLLKTSEDYPDVCLASNLPPSAGMLSMNLCGGRVSHNITGTISSHNKSYHFAFSSRSMDFCEADGTYSHYRNVDVCEKVHPGNASVNSYLLIMNAVRVALTKVLAFTTLLTIKALVH